METTKNRHFNLGDSIGFVSLILAVVMVIMTPPIWLKALLLGLSSWGWFVFARKSHWTHQWPRQWQYISASFVVILFGAVAVPQLISRWRSEHPTPVLKAEDGTTTPKTLHDLFTSDLVPPYSKFTGTHTISFKKEDGEESASVKTEFNLYFDLFSKTEFIAFYIPNTPLTRPACEAIAVSYSDILSYIHGRFAAQMSGPGERPMELAGIRFTGRIFIYHEYPLFVSELDELRKLYEARNLDPQFRGADYLAVVNSNEEKNRK